MDLKQLIFDLCSARGVSGREVSAARVAAEYLKPFAETELDGNGSLIAVMGNADAEKTILLDAHLDQIGLIVTEIDDNGFVKVDKCGGIDIRTMQDSVVVSESGLYGTVCCLPPHLSDGNEGKATPMSKTWIDFGMTSDELKSKLLIGDMLTFATEPRELLNDRVVSAALDNRCGVASLIRVAELISAVQLDYKVIIALSAQEETYGTGARTSAYKAEADEAIVVDVSFASQPDISGQYSKIELEKGPMIAFSSVLNKAMSDRFVSIAREKEIPFQLEPLPGTTGTNAEYISVTRGGVKTALISIPERYMHTPSEVIALCDVENTARLIAEYVISGGAFND